MKAFRILFGFLLLNLPEPVTNALLKGRRQVVDGRKIDSKAKVVSDLVSVIRGANDTLDVGQSREQLARTAQKLDQCCPRDVSKHQISLPGADGDRAARVYLPDKVRDDSAAPTVLYLHGGGWVQGDLDTHDGLCGNLAQLASVRVISYDYRLAPEHPFPAAPDDILACYRALVSGTTKLAVEPERLVVGGDSAGANLTACLMHDIATSGLSMPCGQMLFYPAVDGRLESASMQSLRDQPLLPRSRIEWYLDQYIPKGTDRLTPRISPLFSDRLAGQPPTLIVRCGHDPLWDDGLAYCEKLRAAGVPVGMLDYPGQIHAFMSMSKVLPQGRDAISRSADWLAALLQTRTQ